MEGCDARRGATTRRRASGCTDEAAGPAGGAGRPLRRGNTDWTRGSPTGAPPASRRDDPPVTIIIWLALAAGLVAASAALYGHYLVLPAWLTGPEICQLEEGGCAVLFRSPRASLVGVPNAAL